MANYIFLSFFCVIFFVTRVAAVFADELAALADGAFGATFFSGI